MKSRLFSLLFFSIIFLLVGSTNQESQVRVVESPTLGYGILKGTVILAGSPVSNVDLKIKNSEVAIVVRSDGEGKYRILLPSALYSVSTTEQQDYYSYRRADFFVEPEQETNIDLLLSPKFGQRYSTTYGDGRDVYPPIEQPKYFEYVPEKCVRSTKVLIEYQSTKEEKGFVSFQDVILTYGRYTIDSKLVRFYKKERKFEFVEADFIQSVYVYIDGETIFAKKAVLIWKEGLQLEIFRKRKEDLQFDKRIVIREGCRIMGAS